MQPSLGSTRTPLSRFATVALVTGFLAACQDGPIEPVPMDDGLQPTSPAFSHTAAGSPGRLLGTIGSGGEASTLVELDAASGAVVSTIGPVGYAVNGMEFDPATGTLYATTSFRDPNFNGLITIDVATGAGTPVGAPFYGGSAPCGPDFAPLTNLTIDASGQLYAWSECNDALALIDKSTGIATHRPFGGIFTARYSLDFAPDGTLYLFNRVDDPRLYTVDPATGATTDTGLRGPYGRHGDFDPETGLWYGIDSWQGFGRDSFGSDAISVMEIPENTQLHSLALPDGLHVLTFVGPGDPQTKADCRKGGWEDYGFRNQGQCVRFIETGKDSR